MTYPVNEEHRALRAEADRLLQRLGIPAPAGVMPIGDGYLLLVPALHAIVDRLDKLEAGLCDVDKPCLFDLDKP